MTPMLHLILTPLTLAGMADHRTPMHSAGQYLVTDLTALNVILLTALHRSLSASTTTLSGDHGVASGARSRMTQQTARMFAAFLLGA